jgi:type I restriction-modification system DNA methylase subunit
MKTDNQLKYGAFYTPREYARWIAERTIAPHLQRLSPWLGYPSSKDILSLRILDPGMGNGVMLSAAADYLGDVLNQMLMREGEPPKPGYSRAKVCHECLYGFEIDDEMCAKYELSRHEPITGEYHNGHHVTLPRADGIYPLTGMTYIEGDFLRDQLVDGFGDPDGFDVVIGNPPYLGGGKISSVHGDEYRKQLKRDYPSYHGLADLSAYFFLRAAEVAKPAATIGMIATNTIGQGATRKTGLATMIADGWTIYRADTDVEWPGDAAVTVNFVHLMRGDFSRKLA